MIFEKTGIHFNTDVSAGVAFVVSKAPYCFSRCHLIHFGFIESTVLISQKKYEYDFDTDLFCCFSTIKKASIKRLYSQFQLLTTTTPSSNTILNYIDSSASQSINCLSFVNRTIIFNVTDEIISRFTYSLFQHLSDD